MEACGCDVVGCGKSAVYMRTANESGVKEDYLCAQCFLTLQEFYPLITADYSLMPHPMKTSDPGRRAEQAAEENLRGPGGPRESLALSATTAAGEEEK